MRCRGYCGRDRKIRRDKGEVGGTQIAGKVKGR